MTQENANALDHKALGPRLPIKRGPAHIHNQLKLLICMQGVPIV